MDGAGSNSAGWSSPPPPIQPEASPLWPRHLIDIFIRPSRFFSSQLALGHTPYVLLVTWCFGIAQAMDRIDINLMRSEFGRVRPGLHTLAGSWLYYWAFVLAAGLVAGGFLWLLGGWWYRVRLGWSGAVKPDAKTARLVYIYSSFVLAGPTVLWALIETMTFPNYLAAWQSEEMWSALLLVFPFWSCYSSYRGATTLFTLKRGPARMWFLVLPAVVYFLVLGVLTALFAVFRPEG